MPLDFPANPTNGQIYGNYYYDTSSLSWRSSPLTNGPAYISDIIPSGAPNGGIWYNSADGTLFVKYLDTWVEARSNPKIIPGSIVQVLQSSSATAQVFNAGSQDNKNFYDVSGLSITVTPKFINSKFLITSSVSVGHHTNAYNSYFRFTRDGSAIGVSNSLNNNFQAHAGFRTAVAAQVGVISLNHLDSPATLSPVTYKVQISNTGGSTYPAYVNRSDQSAAWEAGLMSTITLMEVAQ